jgi:(1->4)-alpha-D-glucan 1-alpha-D-glucosylmutase
MNPALVYELSFIELFLLLESNDLSDEERNEWIHFVMRFQQLTGPLMAKGFEDTTLYVYNRLLSLNDVGGSPDKFGISLTEFHDFNVRRSRRQPHAMNATATHDTKRGEDIRARLNVLSEIPELWESNLKKWSRHNRRKKKSMKGVVIPDRNDEYFLYQTLIGALPFKMDEMDSFKVRLKDYIIKAVREAKVHTAWLKPDTDYEENYIKFIDKILTPSDKNLFLSDFLNFQRTISFYGIFNSLSQTLVKMTSPGIPDFYQGTEFWDLNLVDPDNRRPVDFELRMWLLKEIKARGKENIESLIQNLFSTSEDGRIKLFLIHTVLEVRNRYRNLYEKGTYIPLQTEGKYKDNIVAFAWDHKPVYSVTIAPRFLTAVVDENTYPFGKDVWHDTKVILPEDAPDSWTETLTDTELTCKKSFLVGDVFRTFPGALLISRPKRQVT